jgi:hypothetical protein
MVPSTARPSFASLVRSGAALSPPGKVVNESLHICYAAAMDELQAARPGSGPCRCPRTVSGDVSLWWPW